ncbi:hypothetical protein GCM10028800_15390 [Nesterenkonia populi]
MSAKAPAAKRMGAQVGPSTCAFAVSSAWKGARSMAEILPAAEAEGPVTRFTSRALRVLGLICPLPCLRADGLRRPHEAQG